MAKALSAHQAFYPAAALYGMFVLPASVLAMTGRLSGLDALSDPMGHTHEMLFGFALAVVAGNQLGPARGPRVGVLFSFWVAARIAFLVAPASIPSVLLNASFAALLGAQAAPPRNCAISRCPPCSLRCARPPSPGRSRATRALTASCKRWRGRR